MSDSFWQGFWFGLNPMNSAKVCRSMWRVWAKSRTRQARAARLLAHCHTLHAQCEALRREVMALVCSRPFSDALADRCNALIAEQERLLRRSRRIRAAVAPATRL